MTGDPHRGQVWWADVPGDKRRPVLILTRERFVARLAAVLVAPVTSTIRGIPTEVRLDERDGMPQPCAANFDALLTIRKGLLVRPLAELTPQRLDEVCAAYRYAAGC